MLNEINGIMSDSAGNLANVGTYADDVIGYESATCHSSTHSLASTLWQVTAVCWSE